MYFAILAIKRDNPRYWLWFGVIAGMGMQEKYSISVFGLGIVVGLLLTKQRRVFLNQWIWLGGVAAFLIFLPNVLWNIHYDWPFVQLMHAIRDSGRDIVLGPLDFFIQQTLLVDPIVAPIWLAGLLGLPYLHPPAALSIFGVVLCDLLRRVLRLARQELLSGAGVPNAAGGRGGRDRICARPARPANHACSG